MSYQRAVVNCRRCYEAISTIKESETAAKAIPIGKAPKSAELIRDSRTIADARNEAMIALEAIPMGITRERERALTACMNCKYERSEIAEIYQLPK